MKTKLAKAQGGFSLLELVIVMAVLAIVAGAIFEQIQTSSQRSATERTQLDLFQESREFMDQISRDLRQVGYPNPRDFNNVVLGATAQTSGDPTTSTNAAVGLVYVDKGDLWFEGGLDDLGNVLYTQYHYDPSTANGCPCLRRSQQTRAGSPGSETANYNAEVQNVQNLADPNNQIPIFRYYTSGGTTEVPALALPLQWTASATNQTLATIDTIRIQLVVQSPYVDLKTGQAPVVTLVSTVKVNNCSQATTGQLSCSN
jgi:prepilin-type N-terminal cleavage/methylation domain-containing protein